MMNSKKTMPLQNPYTFKHLGMGVYLIDTKVFEDHRGYFLEGWNKELFAKNGIIAEFNQYIISCSKLGAIRGFHYQKEPHGQAKMFRAIRGKIFDVCVDMRSHSKTYGKAIIATFSAEDNKLMFIPKGFANLTLSIGKEDAIVLYMMEGHQVKEAETGIRWDDPDLSIKYPMKPKLLSERDKNLPFLKDIK